jgi:hypothetical protein
MRIQSAPRFTILVATLAAMITLLGGMTVARPAQAADLLQACTPTPDISRVHQTSLSWVRVSERACMQWVPNGNKIRFRMMTRYDWPLNCSITIGVGYPSVSCPLGITLKRKVFTIKSMRVDFQFKKAATGDTLWGGSCNFGKNEYYIGRGAVNTHSCYTAFEAHPAGTYRIRMRIPSYTVGNNVHDMGWTEWKSLRFG